jgi:hypothetical protein
LYGTTGRPLTAQIREFTHTGLQDQANANGGDRSSDDGQNLPRLWPTTRVNERGNYTCDKGNPEDRRPTLDGLARAGTAKKLNPLFVTWLQGMPLGWLCLERSNSAHWEDWLSRSRRLLHSHNLQFARASVKSTRTDD